MEGWPLTGHCRRQGERTMNKRIQDSDKERGAVSAPELLVVVGVPPDERVRCQAPDCNRPVYRRIHVVRDGGRISVYGSRCFDKLFARSPVASASPRYGPSDGRPLSDEERQLLIHNTERLIQRLEREYQAEARRQAELEAERAAARRSASRPPPPPPRKTPPAPPVSRRPAQPSTDERHHAEARAKEIVRARHKVDPDRPGWRGLVWLTMQEILSDREP